MKPGLEGGEFGSSERHGGRITALYKVVEGDHTTNAMFEKKFEDGVGASRIDIWVRECKSISSQEFRGREVGECFP